MIEVENVRKSYGKVLALDGVVLSAPAGCVYGLVGPNGAGKTTLLKIASGAIRPDAGRVLVGGVPVFENVEAKASIASIPSEFYYYGQARVKDMERLHASLFPRFDRQRFAQLTPLFDLDPGSAVRSLSKGMRKQLAFWLALSQRPDVLLLDEPVDGLDPAARRRVWSVVMSEVAERGMTVLVSSHNLRELSDVCNRVGIMDKGKMRLERTLDELQESFVKVQVAFAEGDAEEGAPPSSGFVPTSVSASVSVSAPNLAGFEQLSAALGAAAANRLADFSRIFRVLSARREGRLCSLVVNGNPEQVEAALRACGASFVNLLPLSLEEVFVYELGGDLREIVAD